MSHEMVSTAERRSLALGIGFGIATIMWAIGYVAFMQPGLILGELVFAAELLVLVIGGGVGSLRVVLEALKRDRPVLVLPETGGAAQMIYDAIFEDVYETQVGWLSLIHI